MRWLLVVVLAAAGAGVSQGDPGPDAARGTRGARGAPGAPGGALSLPKLLDSLAKPFAAAAPEGVSSQCRQHSLLYLRALGQLAPWAMHMYDSSTKIPSSLIAGNIVQLGNFDQCVAVKVPDDGGSDVFRGKHCTSTVYFRMPASRGESEFGDLLLAAANASGQHVSAGGLSAPYEWAHCVPSSCSARDVKAALSHRLGLGGHQLLARVSVDPQRCLAATGGRSSQPLKPADVVFICLLIVTVYILAASTACDFFVISKREADGRGMSRSQQVLAAFSLQRNGSALVSMSAGAGTLGCVHGLRVVSICWVVLLHSAYQDGVAPNINKADIPKYSDYWGSMIVMNATLSTDTFFLLSAALLTISFLKARCSTSPGGCGVGGFNPLSFYWHRYVRLTPVYAVVIWFYATLLVRLGSGPLWDTLVGAEQDNCLVSWWANLVYINNFVSIAMPCMNQTWYLAVDMQLFWLSPLVLLPLWRWRRAGRILLGLLILLSVAVPFTITFLKSLSAAMLYTLDQTMLGEVFVSVYSPVYTRAGPYLVGMALGCLLFETRDKKVQLPVLVVTASWMLAVCSCLAVLFGVFQFYRLDHPYSALESAVYAGLHRTVWSAGVAWVVFACVRGYGGPVDALLSWKALLPLSRLSYCLYLCHYAVLVVSHGMRRSPGYFSPYFVIRDALGTLVISVVVAALLCLAFEMPFLNLDRILLPRGSSSKKAEQREDASRSAMAEHLEAAAAPGDLRGYSNASRSAMVEHLEAAAAPGDLRGYSNAAYEK